MDQTEPGAGVSADEAPQDRFSRPSAGPQPQVRLAPATSIPMGAEVRDADGAGLGRVAAVWAAFVLVEPTPGSPMDYWVPVEAIAGYDGDVLVLTVTRAEADRHGWTERPSGGPDRPG